MAKKKPGKSSDYHHIVGKALNDAEFRGRLRSKKRRAEALAEMNVELTSELDSQIDDSIDAMDSLAQSFGVEQAAT